MPVNVALSGKMASGKSTVAALIAERWGHSIIPIAGPLKLLAECAKAGDTEYASHVLEMLCCGSDVRLRDAGVVYVRLCKKYADELGGDAKPRGFLQDFGRELRSVDENIWVRVVGERALAEAAKSFVCDDLRYVNEAQWLKECGFVLVRCECADEVREYRLKQLYPNTPFTQINHPSELDLDSYPLFDYHIDTTQSTTQILAQLEDILGAPLY